MAEERMTDDPLKKGLEDEFVDIELDGLEGSGDGDGDLDEDLIGLTSAKLKEELEKRREREEKAKRELEALLHTAAEKRAAGDFKGAIAFYEKASRSSGENYEEEIWACRTEEYTSTACFYKRSVSNELVYSFSEVREKVLGRMRKEIEQEIAEYEAEAIPLREKVEAGQDSRRDAFRANRNYYLLRVLIALGVCVLFAIGCAIAGYYIVRTKELTAPVLTAVFGALAVIALGVAIFFSRGLFVGQKLVRDNERLSSTEDGARLSLLEGRLEGLRTALEEPEFEIE